MPLDPDELAELKESFDYNDSNADGKIEFQEFVSMLKGLDAFGDNDEARVGFESVDGDGDGLIDLDEFVAWWTEE